MPKIKWKTVEEVTREKLEQLAKKEQRERFKGKDTTKLSAKDKDDLLIQIAKDLGRL